MVAPIRDSRNKFFDKSATSTTTTRMSFAYFENMDVDNVHNSGSDNFNDVRGLTIHPSKPPPSIDEMFITEGSVDYARKMKRQNNDLDEDEVQEPIDSSQLSYTTQKSQGNKSSKVADLSTNTRPQHVNNVEHVCSNQDNNNVFNIQLNYNINQAIDPDSWDGNFQAISLHGSLEHLVLDIKNIKESLIRM